MKRLFLIGAMVASLFAISAVTAPIAAAEDLPYAEKTTFTFNGKRTNVTIRDVIIEVMKFGSAMVGILAVGGFAYAGILYSTAGGNPGQTQKAMTIIVNTTTGIVAYFGIYGVIVFLIPENILR